MRRDRHPSSRTPARIAIAVGLLVAGAACNGTRGVDRPTADSERPEPAPLTAGPADAELRVAVASMIGPVATFEAYDGIVKLIAGRLGRPYRLIQRKTYREINDLLLKGEIDLAFICSGTYAALPAGAPVEILAVPVVDGRAVYHAVIVVRAADGYRSFSDLRGTRFAFSDELSTTGHVYPRWLLAQEGETPDSFFSGTILTGSHDRSILAVHRHLADAAAVHEMVYRTTVVPGSPYWGSLRIIGTSPDFPTPPVVAPTSLSAPMRERMRAILTGLHASPEGRALLGRIGVTGFVPGRPEDYRQVKEMLVQSGVR